MRLPASGKVYLGKHRLIISRRLLEACQDIINGRARRGCNTGVLFSGGLIRCAHCGKAMIGEVIKRKLIRQLRPRGAPARPGAIRVQPEGGGLVGAFELGAETRDPGLFVSVP